MNSPLYNQPKIFRYIPIGDSLSVGYGARAGENWPTMLKKHLKETGINIEIPVNPAHSGWTSQMALDHEIPIVEQHKPDFSTVLIGANDLARGIEKSVFERNFILLLDRLQKALTKPESVIVLNLPDFASTPAAQKYGGHLHVGPVINGYNALIRREAENRKLAFADLYTLTQKMGPDPAYYSYDGFHPSGKGYAQIEKLVYPIAQEMLSKEKGTD